MTAMDLIQAERRRQIEVEGWSPEHDDAHDCGELLSAAVTYLWAGTEMGPRFLPDGRPIGWPWSLDWWKPKDRRSNLIRSGALSLAEIDRRRRAGLTFSHVEQKLQAAVRELEMCLGAGVPA